MKRILLFIMFGIICISSYSQDIRYFQSTEVAIKFNDYGKWSDWEPTVCNIKMDFINWKITIYSKEVQIYKILEEITPPYDSTGRQLAFRIIDQEGDYGTLRLRIQNNGTSQLYVDFSNVSWVYNIRRIR